MFITPEAIFEKAQYLFMSEQFYHGFQAIRECFDKEDVSDKTIFDFLNAKIGVKVEGNEITFSEDIPVDEEYKQELSEILYDYRNIYKHEEYGLLQVAQFTDFQVDNFYAAEENEALKELQKAKNKIIPISETTLSKAGLCGWGDYMYINDKGIYFLTENRKTLIEEICVIKEDIEDVVNMYDKFFF